MVFPTTLPSDPFGVLAVAIIVLGTLVAKGPFSSGQRRSATQNDGDTRAQVLIDTFTEQIVSLKREMAKGFAQRDAEIQKLKDASEIGRKKYRASIRHIQDLRAENPGTRHLVPPEIAADL